MKEYMELPVNKEGFMHTGTIQAALYAILTGKAYTGKLNIIISELRVISENTGFDYFRETETFIKQAEHMELDFDGRHGELRFLSHPYEENKYAYLYKEKESLEGDYHSIEVRVDYMQDSDAFSCIKLILSNGIWNYNRKVREVQFENECSVKLTSQGRLLFHSLKKEEDIRIFKFEDKKPVFLKLEAEASAILVKYSYDGKHWILLHEEDSEDIIWSEIGFLAEPRINTFYYDFFISNIQLFFHRKRKQLGIFPPLEYNERYFSEALDGYSVPVELLYSINKGLIDVFIGFIKDSKYIYLKTQNLSALDGIEPQYESILYGYDRKKQVFKQMIFLENLQFSEISFDEILKIYQSKKNSEEIITIYGYKSWRYYKSFDADVVISSLKTYLEGTGSFAVTSRKKIIYFSKRPIVCGIKVLDEFLNKEEYIDDLLVDKRMSGQIHEHYRIMLEMLEFMEYIGMLTEEEQRVHKKSFKNLIEISARLKYLAAQNEIAPISDIKEKLTALLMELKEKDKIGTKKLIQCLEEAGL